MAVLYPAAAFRRSIDVWLNALEPPFRDCRARAQRAVGRPHPNRLTRQVKPENILSSGACCHVRPNRALLAADGGTHG
jgi:hypothetical protein